MEIVSGSSSSSSVSEACAESVSVNIMPSGMGVLLTGQGSLGKQSCKMDDRRGGGNGSPWKVPRTDAFAWPELKMHMSSDNNLIRNTCCGSNCLVSDGRLAVSPTKSNSNASDAVLFSYDNSSTIFCEGWILRNELVLSAGAGASAGTRPSVPFQLYHNKSAGITSSFASMGREMRMGMGMGMVTAERPPFSPSQWRELEQQALIFKYMMAGVPVPSDLLLPIRKSLLPFTALVGSHRHPPPNLTAWSSFQMGYGGNVDPEPGRCRRTDGKKWRCSRDVVPDQKYCERHMHRGRHRGSRKPVEGHTATATASASTPNSAPILGRKNLSGEMSLSGDGNQFQQFPLHLDGGEPDTLNKDYRYVNGIKGEDIDHHIQSIEASGSSALSNEWRLASKAAEAGATPFSEFRINSNGSTLNHNSPSPQLTSLRGQHFGPISEGSRYASLQEGVREEQPLRHFFDDWPRSSTDAWTSDVHSEERSRSKHRGSSTTQLSISIPKASHSSASNTSSPRGKLSLSPLKLAMTREGKLGDDILGDPIEMGLAVGMNMKVEERHDRQHNWIPIAWENNPMGMLGPLAEVLRSSTPRGSKPRLNLMDDINKSGRSPWVERGRQSPGSCFASSPTGVLQKTLGCVSDANSAATSKTDSSS